MADIQNPAAFVDPVAPRLGYMLRRASLAMMADLGASLVVMNLRPVEATILMLIGVNPGCTQSDIGRALGIKRANMVPLIAGLSARGYLDKAPVDGRSLALTLTATGEEARALAEQITDAHEARFKQVLGGQDPDGLQATLALIAGASF